jgi:Ca2+-binding EF-hand superfamily protein
LYCTTSLGFCSEEKERYLPIQFAKFNCSMAWQPQQMYAQGFAPRNAQAYHLFCQVDRNRSGTIDLVELQHALSAGGYVSFNRKTTRLLSRMFDFDRSGTLAYPEFESLMTQLGSWQGFFLAQTHGSGKITYHQIGHVLASLGLSLPEPLPLMVFQAYDEDVSGTIGFDEYVMLLAELNCLTTTFRKYDPSSCGSATLCECGISSSSFLLPGMIFCAPRTPDTFWRSRPLLPPPP